MGDDKEDLIISFILNDNNLILEFATAIKWISFSKEEALNFANTIIKEANKLEEVKDEDYEGNYL